MFEYPKRRRYIFKSYLRHGSNEWPSPSMTYQMPSNSIHSWVDSTRHYMYEEAALQYNVPFAPKRPWLSRYLETSKWTVRLTCTFKVKVRDVA